MRQGGSSANTGKGGRCMQPRVRCSVCKRDYAMKWALENHERLCKEYNQSR